VDSRQVRRIRRNDRIARWVISVGGCGVVVCVLTMVVMIAGVALPLFRPASAVRVHARRIPADPGEAVLAVGLSDEGRTAYAVLDSGRVLFFDPASGEATQRLGLDGGRPGRGRLRSAHPHSEQTCTLNWDDGSASLIRIFLPAEDGSLGPGSAVARVLPLAAAPPESPPAADSRMWVTEQGHVLHISLLPDNRLRVRRLDADVETGDGAEAPHAEAWQEGRTEAVPFGRIIAFTADRHGEFLYAGTERGHLLRWDIGALPELRLLDAGAAWEDGTAVTVLAMVFGDVSVGVGAADGRVATWAPVRLYGPGSEPRLQRLHRLAPHGAAVTGLSPTEHDKSLLSLASDGSLQVSHMTSERLLLTLRGERPWNGFGLSLRGDGLIAVSPGGHYEVWRLRIPHPEVSWRVLFGRVHYESYDRPEFVWQSSSANDNFEAKFSLVPLIFGSLKGTFYALALTVPLALLGAVYVSQFTRPEVRNLVKPTVEVMAAVPSVVIGFLAALWLAPRVEEGIVGIFLFGLMLPLAVVIFLLLWQGVRGCRQAKRVERGWEFVALVPVLLIGGGLAWGLGPVVEGWLFAGDFRQWLFEGTGARFDQRNSIVIAFALGVAVIPVVFTIAEDALSNVPSSLRAASLALGASRWQTVRRVILPSASPGIFAGIIIGFGRAVGETMIVLMATGNTPVLSPSPFNGMRTLSANIAVEIPEAPVGGTLYRILFLSAVLLFVLTSGLNTAAELLRHRLRRKYGY